MRFTLRALATICLFLVTATAQAQDGLPLPPRAPSQPAPAEQAPDQAAPGEAPDPGAPLPDPAEDVATLVQGNNAFALDLYRRLSAEEGNQFLSPYSISTALGMTYAGARGETARQMAEVLRFDLDQARLHAAFGSLQARLNGRGGEATEGFVGALGGEPGAGEGEASSATPGEAPARAYQLSVANALWVEQDFSFLDSYLDLVRSSYGAGLSAMDFKNAPDAARETINAWVEDETQDKIKDLLKPGTIKPSTRLVLTNAIYFKGTWKTSFDPERTWHGPFELADGSVAEQVPLMNMRDDLRYAETDDLQVLELPYTGDEVSMMILLPRDPSGLGALEASLTAERVAELAGSLREHEVDVLLPRFEMTSEFELGDTLAGMGMTDAFDPDRADLSGINGRRDLAISKVVHKAFVEVNEEGTEAAAATAVVVVESTSIGPNSTKYFRANRPFMFMIRDGSGSILFVGRVADPR